MQSSFPTFKSFEDYIFPFFEDLGYVIVLKNSDICSQRYRYKCDRGGHLKERPVYGKREKLSKRIDCPFELYCRFIKKTGLYHVDLINDNHNHEPATCLLGHSAARKLTDEQKEEASIMLRKGIKAKQVVSYLIEKNEKVLIIAKDLYNLKAKSVEDELSGLSWVDCLLKNLQSGNYYSNFQKDNVGRIDRLFFSHRISVGLIRQYGDVFLMDSTYKTNKFNMPLLNIVGITGCNTTFYAAFAFLRKEEESDYSWALEQFSSLAHITPSVIVTDREMALMKGIERTFPNSAHFLCIWHMQKNILTKCKELFPNAEDFYQFQLEINSIIYVESEIEMQDKLENMRRKYSENPAAFNYFTSTWLPYKDKFITCFTNLVFHLNSTATSRVESAHVPIKTALGKSTGNLNTVVDSIEMIIEDQYRTICANLENDMSSISRKLRDPFFQFVVFKVSIYALNLVYDKLKDVRHGIVKTCTSRFRTTMGLPCSHELRDMILAGKVLSVADFHSHYHLRQIIVPEENFEITVPEINDFIQKFKSASNNEQQRVLGYLHTNDEIQPPNIIEGRRRPIGYRGRVLQVVEEAEGANSRACSNCGHLGHNSRTCRQPINSTRRFPSAYEYVDGTAGPSNQRRCGNCREYGHKKSTCRNPARNLL